MIRAYIYIYIYIYIYGFPGHRPPRDSRLVTSRRDLDAPERSRDDPNPKTGMLGVTPTVVFRVDVPKTGFSKSQEYLVHGKSCSLTNHFKMQSKELNMLQNQHMSPLAVHGNIVNMKLDRVVDDMISVSGRGQSEELGISMRPPIMIRIVHCQQAYPIQPQQPRRSSIPRRPDKGPTPGSPTHHVEGERTYDHNAIDVTTTDMTTTMTTMSTQRRQRVTRGLKVELVVKVT